MAGVLQNNPWNAGPFGNVGYGATPGFAPQQAYGQPWSFGPSTPFTAPQIQQLQQVLQILPQQIHQLQQTIQFLPQHVAQLVVQTLIQSQAGAQSFGQQGFGAPFQSIPAVSPYSAGQPGYVM